VGLDVCQGVDGSFLLGGINCTVLSRTSDIQLTVQVPPGQGLNLNVDVQVQTRVSNTLLFGYAPPVINSISPDNGPTAGNVSITLYGTSFGSDDQVAGSAVVLVGSSPCNVTYHNHTVTVNFVITASPIAAVSIALINVATIAEPLFVPLLLSVCTGHCGCHRNRCWSGLLPNQSEPDHHHLQATIR
jgi:hypothetical protein